jgi:hypothetical protein
MHCRVLLALCSVGLCPKCVFAVKQQCCGCNRPCTTSPKLLHVGSCSSVLVARVVF